MFGFGKNTSKIHPDFPKLPLNIRMMGLVKFKPSSQTYFLLNEKKMSVRLPSEDCMVAAVSSFKLFDLNIHRVYLDCNDPKTVIQIHSDGNEILDVILFNQKYEFVVENDPTETQNWRNMIGYKDIGTPDGFDYFRDWSGDVDQYGEYIKPVVFVENYFSSSTECVEISNEAMLYNRILEGGTEDDIEYFLVGFRRGLKRYHVEGWVGTVIGTDGIEFI